MHLLKNIPKYILGAALTAIMCIPLTANAAVKETLTTGSGTSGSTAGVSSKSWIKTGENSWSMDSDGDGNVDVVLEKTVNSAGEEEWTYTFTTLNASEYKVYEEMTQNFSKRTDGSFLASGYSSNGTDNKTAVLTDPGTTQNKTYTIENTKSHTEKKYGSLTIKKTVSNVDSMPSTNDTFTFDVVLTSSNASDLSGTKVFGETAFTDGKATVSLTQGQSITFSNIPEGVGYTVTEQTKDKYSLSSKTNDTGTISGSKTSTATFVNKSNYIPPESAKTTSFKIAKDVTGNAVSSGDSSYTFNVLLTDLTAYAEVKATDGTNTVSATADASGMATLQNIAVKPNATWTVSGVTVGAKYQVQEAAGNYVPSYEIMNAGSGGSIAKARDDGSLGESLSTAMETAEENESITIKFTNTIDKYQDIVLVKKSLTAAGKDDETDETQYEITVKFSGLTPKYQIKSTKGPLVADDDGTAETTVLITRNETVTFSKVPVGTTYRFTEEKNQKTASYEITGTNVTAVSKSGTNTDYQTALSTGTITKNSDGTVTIKDEVVDANESATITFTNKSPQTAKLKVIKYSGTAANPEKQVGGAEFALYYENGNPVNYTTVDGKASNIIVINSDGTSDVLESTLFGVGRYYLIETKAPEGHMISSENLAFEITKDDLGKTIKISAYDDQLIVLPVTGGPGVTTMVVASGIVTAIGAAIIVFAMRRRCMQF